MPKPCRDESLHAALQRVAGLCFVAKDTIGRATTERSPRGIISGTLYHLAFEHAASILLLVQETHHGSALALLRPAYEALLRGVWLAHAASDAHIVQLLQPGNEFPNNKSMANKINQHAPEELRAAVDGIHQVFPAEFRNDLTHGGIFQASQRFNRKAIGSNFSEEMLVILVQATGFLLAASAIGATALTGNGEDYKKALNALTQAL